MFGVCQSHVGFIFIHHPPFSGKICSVKLLSGSLSHQNPGNQFGHAAPIFTILLLALTAVLQIICLNRGLKVYDSTLVVPVFYGVYTATGYSRLSLLECVTLFLTHALQLSRLLDLQQRGRFI